MYLEGIITDGCCLNIFIGSTRIALLSHSYRTITYKFPLVDLCGKAPGRSLNPFLFILNGIISAHSSCVFTFSGLFLCLGKILYLPQPPTLILHVFYWRFVCSWSRCSNAVSIIGGRLFNNCLLLTPGHLKKFPFFIAFRKVFGVRLK